MTTARVGEADLQRAVIDAARWHGWLVHHCRPEICAAVNTARDAAQEATGG